MKSGMHLALGVLAFGTAILLQGCTFGSGSEQCDGDGCSCSWTFHSFWARIVISGVPIEHAARVFYVPDVAMDLKNATFSPCCSAIFDQIDYDEGKSASMPNLTVDSFRESCGASPNKDIASVATGRDMTTVSELMSGVGVVGRRLNGLRKAAAAWQQAAPQKHLQAGASDQGYQPIYDGQEGRDCEVATAHGFPLNGQLISGGSMKLTIKWADPVNGGTRCCDALTPVLQKLYIDGVSEAQLPKEARDAFTSACTLSPNLGIALAAYRSFNHTPHARDIAV